MAIEGDSKGSIPSSAAALIEDVGQSIDAGRLPFRVYNDRDIHELELERIFGRCWVFVGHETEIPEPGDYLRRQIGEDNFIFIRDEDGEIHIFFDFCPHRGTQICRGDQGNASHLRCPYHGWTYKNTGDLIGVPREDVCYKALDKSEFGLVEVPRMERYEGLVFASLDPDVPDLNDYLGDITWYMDTLLKLPRDGWEVVGVPHRWTFEADWKTGCDNFAGDDYHFFYSHQAGVESGFTAKPYQMDPETDHFGLRSRHHCQCGGHTATFGILGEEYSPWMGHSEHIIETFDKEGLTDEQFDIARRGVVNIAHIFPNLTIMNTSISDSETEASFFNLRKYRPNGVGRMELVNWVLAPKAATAEEKENMWKAAQASFSPTGTIEQDDAVIWSWITQAAGSTFTKLNNFKTNYQMGLDGMSDTAIDPDWPGPGDAYDSPFEDGNQRMWHKTWYQTMVGEFP